MKNSDIIQMLLEDGGSAAVPNLSKENARTLAQRHGNCGDKKPKTLLDSKFHYTELKKEPINKYHEKSQTDRTNSKSKLNEEKEAISNTNNIVQPKYFPFSMECYETLVDSILACHNHYSLMIGLFYKYANYFRNQNIMIIKEIFLRKAEETQQKDEKLKLTPFLVTVILLTSLLFGYLLSLIISWEVGLSVGFTILFVMSIGLGLIFIGSYSQDWKMALQAGSLVLSTLESFKLLLKILFVNPSFKNCVPSNQINTICIHLVISNYSNNFHAAATFIENIWLEIEKKYTNFCIRFLKASLNNEYGDRQFKRICCLPTFMYFIIATICLLSIGTIFKVNESNISQVFINKLTLIAFSFLAIILILSLIGLLYLLLKMICCILHAPTHNLKGFLKSYNAYGEASTQSFLISEFKCVLNFLSHIDQYKTNEKSFVLCFIDATGAIDLKILTEFCSFCQILLKNRNEIPICIIVLADNQIYTISDTADQMVEYLGFSKLLSLSLYLDETTNNLLILDSNQNEIQHDTSNQDKKAKTNENIQYMGIKKQCNGYKSDIIIHKLYKSPYDQSEDLDGLNVKNISDYLIIKSKLSDFNVPSIRDLVIVVTYAYKVSKVQTISTDLYRLIDLVTLFYHWPFIYSWITLFVTNNCTKIKKSLTIRKLYSKYVKGMLQALVEEPIVLELSRGDLSHDILESIINDNEIGELTIDEFMILNAACHLRHMPIQTFIKSALKRNQAERSKNQDMFYADGYSDESLGWKSKYLSIQTVKTDTTNQSDGVVPLVASNNSAVVAAVMGTGGTGTGPITGTGTGEKEKMTPRSFRKSLQYIKQLFASMILSEMTIDDVVWMIGQIKEISQDNVMKYQERIRQINANGLVLSSCDFNELRAELDMTFGDWHLFKTLINYLKCVEEANETALLNQVVTSGSNIGVTGLNIGDHQQSPFNPLSLLEKPMEEFSIDSTTDPDPLVNPLQEDSQRHQMDPNPVKLNEELSPIASIGPNNVASGTANTVTINLNSKNDNNNNNSIQHPTKFPCDLDSIWKRKTPLPYTVNISKDHFLSPVTISSVSSPKLQSSHNTILDDNQCAVNFYSIKPNIDTEPLSNMSNDNAVPLPPTLDNNNNDEEINKTSESFVKCTKSLPREASFESTTTFSTQLSSPRNSKCLYDVDSKTKIYKKSTLASSSSGNIIKIKHNIGCQSYNQLRTTTNDEDADNDDDDDDDDEDDGEIQSAANDEDYEADGDNELNASLNMPRRIGTAANDEYFASRFQSYLRKNDESKRYHSSSLYDIDKTQFDDSINTTSANNNNSNPAHQQHHHHYHGSNTQGRTKGKFYPDIEAAIVHSNATATGHPRKFYSQTNMVRGHHKSKPKKNKVSSIHQKQGPSDHPEPGKFQLIEPGTTHNTTTTPDIIFRSKSYTNPINSKSTGNYFTLPNQQPQVPTKSAESNNGKHVSKQRPRHKGSYAEALNNEISNSEI